MENIFHLCKFTVGQKQEQQKHLFCVKVHHSITNEFWYFMVIIILYFQLVLLPARANLMLRSQLTVPLLWKMMIKVNYCTKTTFFTVYSSLLTRLAQLWLHFCTSKKCFFGYGRIKWKILLKPQKSLRRLSWTH